MHLTSNLLAGFTVLSAASALPSLHERDTCQYKYLPNLNSISQHVPETSTATTTSPFFVSQIIGRRDQIVSFRPVPADSTSQCSLQLDYKPGHNAVVDNEGGDPTLINVSRLSDSGSFPSLPTWDNTETRGQSFIASFNFPQGAALNQAQVITIATFPCDQILTFRFSVAQEGARGSVSLDEDSQSGLRIAYNC